MKAFPPPGNGAHNRLPARMDVDVLDRHLLLTLVAMAVQDLMSVVKLRESLLLSTWLLASFSTIAMTRPRAAS